jgi:hypothetical protein
MKEWAKHGGEKGIRTLETLLEPTRFPGVRLRPLGHLSTKPVFDTPGVRLDEIKP